MSQYGLVRPLSSLKEVAVCLDNRVIQATAESLLTLARVFRAAEMFRPLVFPHKVLGYHIPHETLGSEQAVCLLFRAAKTSFFHCSNIAGIKPWDLISFRTTIMAERLKFIDRLRTQVEQRNLNDRAYIEGPLGILLPPARLLVKHIY